MKVINLFSGPGSGKSTTAAFLFAYLKNAGVKTELAREVAKDFIYEGRQVQLKRNQLLLTAMQYARLKDLEHSDCELAITDAPLALGAVYARRCLYYDELCELIKKLLKDFTNYNVFIKRTKPYQKFGRLQDEGEAKILDGICFHVGNSRDFGGEFWTMIEGNPAGQLLLSESVQKEIIR